MFSDPQSIIEQFGITESMHVADIGAGSGHYSLVIAPLLKTGRVYAIDVQRDMLDRLKAEAKIRNLNNVEILWADAEKPRGTKLVNDSLDAAIISNVLFQIENKDSFIEEVKRILKPGGRILLIDWVDSFGGMGPISSHVVKKEDAITLLTKHGFTETSTVSAGAQHYGIIFTKK